MPMSRGRKEMCIFSLRKVRISKVKYGRGWLILLIIFIPMPLNIGLICWLICTLKLILQDVGWIWTRFPIFAMGLVSHPKERPSSTTPMISPTILGERTYKWSIFHSMPPTTARSYRLIPMCTSAWWKVTTPFSISKLGEGPSSSAEVIPLEVIGGLLTGLGIIIAISLFLGYRLEVILCRICWECRWLVVIFVVLEVMPLNNFVPGFSNWVLCILLPEIIIKRRWSISRPMLWGRWFWRRQRRI